MSRSHLHRSTTLPWESTGAQLAPRQSIETWTRSAGMDWSICSTPVRYLAETSDTLGELKGFEDQRVLYRSDTLQALSVVSNRYQVVQPREVLEFYRDLTEQSGFELETAGVLKGGRKFWALARTGKQAAIKSTDVINGYLLLATSCDGSLATTATPTTVRVVCSNTLNIALRDTAGAIKVPHRTSFDAPAVKRQLGVAVSHWDSFIYRMKILAGRRVKDGEARKYFRKVMVEASHVAPVDGSSMPANANSERSLAKVQEIFDGRGRGAELAAARGTAWGLLNAVTEFVDHDRRARSAEHRMDSAWFGQGAQLKQRALDYALALAD